MNLVHCHEDAYRVEFDDRESDFPQRLGLTVFERDFVRNDVFDLPKVEAVWCGVERCSSTSNRLIGSCAKSTSFSSRADSWFCSCRRSRPSAVSLSTGFRGSEDTFGYLASDHINAFTPSTVAFTCERAGFETIEVTPSFPGPFSLFNRVPPLASLVDGSTYISRAIPNWEYHPKATRQASNQVSS